MGFAAVINDLHKGRDTGPIWKAIIDVSAGLLLFISITGLVLLYFVHKYRLAGVIQPAYRRHIQGREGKSLRP